MIISKWVGVVLKPTSIWNQRFCSEPPQLNLSWCYRKPLLYHKWYNVFHVKNIIWNISLLFRVSNYFILWLLFRPLLYLPTMSELCKLQKPVVLICTLLHDRNQTFNSLTREKENFQFFRVENKIQQKHTEDEACGILPAKGRLTVVSN